MSAARTARAPARRPSRSTATRKRTAASKQKPGLLDSLPVSKQTARRIALWAGAGATLIVILAFLLAFRVPQRVAAAVGEQIGAAGFAVKRVELRGLSRMDQETVYRAVLDQPSRAMPMVDLEAIRAKLMSYPWVKEARVSRRLPDTLVVEIVEREPVAVWQYRGRLQLIDIEGVALADIEQREIGRLPLVVGPDAQHQVAALNALLDGAPELRPRIVAASWIGGRRWDLTFATHETLALPEGEAEARAALQRFVRLAAEGHLFDGRFLRFDMRIENQMIVQRRTAPSVGAPQNGVPAAAPRQQPAQPAAEPPTDLTRTI